MGHDELRQLAVTYLGTTRLQGYLQCLHAWAEAYRQQGWPVSTPEYLLRDYYRLLHVNDDLDRVIACATDPARHDRMLDLTGGTVPPSPKSRPLSKPSFGGLSRTCWPWHSWPSTAIS